MENELISLIKYVSRHINKKIIMNSRITIYNEAKEHSGLFADFCVFIEITEQLKHAHAQNKKEAENFSWETI